MGFETDPNDPQKVPSAACVIHDGLSVCVATDKIRPCTASQLLAYQFMQGNDLPQVPVPVSETQEQQSFTEERNQPTKEQENHGRAPMIEWFNCIHRETVPQAAFLREEYGR